ncbi:MAG: UvrD-helicase domain-containing protein [Oscillospiraceae bacterium]|jgi:ATP-dependent helicase/nuclease subunit A|nr:UvrD-helicase domain-containing protein [Oscillospiraceae bacterium]
MSFTPTPQQRQAITGRGALLVTAAAGSGKTAVLTERVLRMLTDENNPVDAGGVFAATFTRPAAAQLRQKIEQRLAEEIKNQPGNKRLRRQKLMISGAAITTIDAFCLSLARQYFSELNISAGFTIASESLMRQLREQAMRELFDECFEADDREFLRLIALVDATYGDENLKNAIFMITDFLRSQPYPERWMEAAERQYAADAGFESSPWIRALFSFAKTVCRGALSRLNAVIPEMEGDEKMAACHLGSFISAKTQLARLIGFLQTGNFDGASEMVKSFGFPPQAGALRGYENDGFKETVLLIKKLVTADVARLKNAFCGEKTALRDMSILAPYVTKLFELVRRFTKNLSALKAERRVLTFDDVEFAALSLLTRETDGKITYTPLAAQLSQQYAEICVDEYQDTNDLQDALYNALSNGGEKLFLVGDVKQSIYRFRKANPENFLAYRCSFPEYDPKSAQPQAKITLSGNFRSREGICGFVNFCFALLMSREAGEMTYEPGDRLVKMSAYPPREEPDVAIHMVDGADIEEHADTLEARYIATIIKQLMEDPNALADEENPGQTRPARYSDFAILLRSPQGHIGRILEELTAGGIPVWSAAGKDFFKLREIRMALSLLRAVNNPLSDIAFLAAMLSPVFGFTAEEAAHYRVYCPHGSVYQTFWEAARCGDEKAKSAFDTLSLLSSYAKTLSAGRFLQKLCDEFGLSAAAVAIGGKSALANIRILMETAREFEEQGQTGASAFLRYMDGIAERGGTLEAAGQSGGHGDAVRVISIHRSKGLQFPITFVAGCGQSFKRGNHENIVLNPRLGLSLKIYEDERQINYTTLPREAIRLQNERESIAEELRILYVAATRAQERLYFVAAEKKPAARLKEAAVKLAYGGVSDSGEWIVGEDDIRPSAEAANHENGRGDPACLPGTAEPSAVLLADSFLEWLLFCALLHPDGGEFRKCSEVDIIPNVCDSRLEAKIVSLPLSLTPYEANSLYAAREGSGQVHRPVPTAEILAVVREQLAYKYPHDILRGVAAKRIASQLDKDEEEYGCTLRPAFMSAVGLSPAQRGTALHGFMQYADYARAKADPRAELARLVREKFLTRAEADAVDINRVNAFFASGMYDRIDRSPQVTRELRFMEELPLSAVEPNITGYDDEKIVVQGIADCVFLEDGELVILDYKTDRCDAETLAGRYKSQLATYARALSRLYNKPVKECLLYSFYLSAEISVDILTISGVE